jgi:hypothetical protein
MKNTIVTTLLAPQPAATPLNRIGIVTAPRIANTLLVLKAGIITQGFILCAVSTTAIMVPSISLMYFVNDPLFQVVEIGYEISSTLFLWLGVSLKIVKVVDILLDLDRIKNYLSRVGVDNQYIQYASLPLRIMNSFLGVPIVVLLTPLLIKTVDNASTHALFGSTCVDSNRPWLPLANVALYLLGTHSLVSIIDGLKRA